MKNCPACGHERSVPIYAGLLRCPQCSFVYMPLEMSDEEIRGLYDATYFTGDEYHDYIRDRRLFEKNFRRFYTLMTPYLRETDQHLLEIGSAYGFFMHLVRDRFHTEGVEISAEAAAYARNELSLDTHGGDFETIALNRPDYDVICLWDTIEHISRLEPYFLNIRRISKPDTLLFITTNDIGSLNARMRKARWRQIHPPTHIWYFSRKSMRAFLDRHGFETLDIKAVGYHRSLDNMLYRIFMLSNRLSPLYRLAQKVGITRLSLYLNLYDIMFVVARYR